ncbi:MAG: hypothetical protein IJ909_01185 [Fibrobacter sp.]|nr:hypothetical protein [Fibrobacter sp.]
MQPSFAAKSALLATALAIVGCGDDSNNNNNPQSVQSVKSIYNLGDCTSSNEKQLVYVESENSGYVCSDGDWVKADELSSSSSNRFSTKSPDESGSSDESETISVDGQAVKTTKLSNGLTYTIESVDHCPDGWHEMTFDECKALHEQGISLESTVLADPFEIAGKSRAEKCRTGLSKECLIGTWTLNSISHIDTKDVIADFSSAQGGTLNFTDDGIYHYIRSTAGNCPGSLGGGIDDKGTWKVTDNTSLEFYENKQGDCIPFATHFNTTPTIEIVGESVNLYLNKVIFQPNESDALFTGSDTEVFISDASFIEICNENGYAASVDKKTARGTKKTRCVK